jgi:hypothetical protein
MASYTPAFMEKVKANPDDYIQTPLQIIRKPRPSPRTIGTTVNPETGEVIKFQKFGAQQLEFVDPTKPSLGVREIIPKSVDPFGGLLKGVFGTKTVRDTAYPELSISGTVDKEPLIPSFDFGDLFGAIDKHGCECEACKNGTGQCSDKNPKCNSWDIGCEVSEGVTDIITDPVSSWWDKYGIWVYVVLGVIGLGILLWLLRPLFGFAKNITET